MSVDMCNSLTDYLIYKYFSVNKMRMFTCLQNRKKKSINLNSKSWLVTKFIQSLFSWITGRNIPFLALSVIFCFMKSCHSLTILYFFKIPVPAVLEHEAIAGLTASKPSGMRGRSSSNATELEDKELSLDSLMKAVSTRIHDLIWLIYCV